MTKKIETDDHTDAKMVEITTTDARLEQLDAVLATGAVRPIAYDAELFAAHEVAEAAAERFAARHPDASPRETFNRYRGALGRQADIANHPVHHHGFPMHEHQEDVVNPEMLEVTRPGRLEAGSGAPAHEQKHEIYGDESRKYETMAWGDLDGPAKQQLRAWEAHQNPAVRVPLDEVRNRIDGGDQPTPAAPRPEEH